MKTLKSIFNEKKTLLTLLLSVFMLLNLIMPISVFAEDKYEISFDNTIEDDHVTYNVGGQNVVVTVENVTELTSPIQVDYDQKIYLSNFNPDTMEVKAVVNDPSDDFSVVLTVDKDSNEENYYTSLSKRTNDGGLPNDLILKINPTGDPGDNNQPFEGTALFAWNNDGKVCVAEIKDLKSGGMEGYEINYIPASTVVDFINEGQNTTLDINKVGNDYFWLWDSAQFIIQNESIMKSWDAFAKFMDVEDNRRTYGIDPCGAINRNSTICTNGGRSFRATIYDTQYEAVTFSAKSEDYQYFPDFWDPVFFSSTVDVSGTSKDNPADYEAYLLEDTIRFNTEEHSKSSIKSVKALVANEDAVSVKNNNGVFEVTFKSHYYDAVVLELTDTENNHYYLRICRTVMQVHDTFGPDSTEDYIIADVYYDEGKKGDDFEVYATINYDDGTQKTVKATTTEFTDPIDGKSLGYELKGGNNLRKSSYKVAATPDMVSVSYTVVYKKDSNDQSYGGTFAGSGNGVTYDIEERHIIY